MPEKKVRERVHKLIVELREMGLTYDEIEEFWKECIKKEVIMRARSGKTVLTACIVQELMQHPKPPIIEVTDDEKGIRKTKEIDFKITSNYEFINTEVTRKDRRQQERKKKSIKPKFKGKKRLY